MATRAGELLISAANLPEGAVPLTHPAELDALLEQVLSAVSGAHSRSLYLVLDPSAQREFKERLPRVPILTHPGSQTSRVAAVLSPHRSVLVVWTGGNGWWSTERAHAEEAVRDALPRAALPAGPPLDPETLEIIRTLTLARRHAIGGNREGDLTAVLNILKTISSRRRSHDILYAFVEEVAKSVPADRCSLVRIREGEDQAYVLASHEDRSVKDVTIDLSKYPEIMRVMQTARAVAVEDVATDPLMEACREPLKQAGIHALLVVPIVLFSPQSGSFLLRAQRRTGSFSQREVQFCEIAAEAAANALERADLFDSLERNNAELAQLATTDALTSLRNNRYFRSRLDEEYYRSQRYGVPLSLMLIDLDDFKKLNDTYGHLAGDAVLKDVASRMQRTFRKNDVLARYGGEEFVAILPQTDIEGAHAQAERLLHEISSYGFDALPDDAQVTTSIGVARLDTDKMKRPQDLIACADKALYQAKAAGKNCVKIGEGTG